MVKSRAAAADREGILGTCRRQYSDSEVVIQWLWRP